MCLAIQRALDDLAARHSQTGLEILAGSITKHWEVSFPTQVRYDIVFIIGPVIVIWALHSKEQILCQHGKTNKKQRDNFF